MGSLENYVIPVLREMKQFEKLLHSQHEIIIFLETRLSQLKDLVDVAHKHNKKVFVHADLVQGLKSDEYGMEYLIRNIKVDGIISTRGKTISFVKKHNVIGILRLFALDSHALDHNLSMCQRVQPDYIEVLPGIVPQILTEVHERTGIPVIAGGLIRTKEDVALAFQNGAKAVSTSDPELWNLG